RTSRRSIRACCLYRTSSWRRTAPAPPATPERAWQFSPCATASRCSRENRRLRRCGNGSPASTLESGEAIDERVQRADGRVRRLGEGEGVLDDPQRGAEVAPSMLVGFCQFLPPRYGEKTRRPRPLPHPAPLL